MFPPSDAFSAEITAKQGDFTFSGLLTFSSESGLTLSYSEPSDIAGITVSLKDDTAKVTCPKMEPVIVSLPDSSALCFTKKVFDALKNGECDGYAFGGRIINEGTFGGTDFRVEFRLIVFGFHLEICLRMLAYGANIGSVLSDYDMAAV